MIRAGERAGFALDFSDCDLCKSTTISVNFTGDPNIIKLDCGHYFHQRCIEKHILTGDDKARYCPVTDCNQEIDQTSDVVQTSLANRDFYKVEPYVYLALSGLLFMGATGAFGKDVARVSLVSGYFATGYAALGFETPPKLVVLSSLAFLMVKKSGLIKACSSIKSLIK